jgi:hypothetical protein
MSGRQIFLQCSVLLSLGACAGCGVCRANWCDDNVSVITSAFFPETTDTYLIEIDFDGSHFECEGNIESRNNDHWTCSEGVEAQAQSGWDLPQFVIERDREDVNADDVHVKISLADVLIFDEDVHISWQESNTDYSREPPCGCWAGIVQPHIDYFDPPG